MSGRQSIFVIRYIFDGIDWYTALVDNILVTRPLVRGGGYN